MRQGRQPRLGFPPLHPFSPSDLNQPTTNGRGSKRVRTWWKEEKPTPSKRLSPKEGPNKSKWGKWGLTRGVILRSHLHPRPYSNAGWSSSACQCLYQGLSRREGRLCGWHGGAGAATPWRHGRSKSLRRHEVLFSLKRDLMMVSLSISPFLKFF